MRHTRATTGDRRSHHALKDKNLSKCSNCGASHLRHHACASCGTYRGKKAIDIMAKLAKKTKKEGKK